MSNEEKLQYARSRLGLARMVGDTAEVEKWKEHIAYWEAFYQSVHWTRVSVGSKSIGLRVALRQ